MANKYVGSEAQRLASTKTPALGEIGFTEAGQFVGDGATVGSALVRNARLDDPAPMSGRNLVAIGDSICAQNAGPRLGPTTTVDPYGSLAARGYLMWMNVLLGQRFNILSNAGIGGQRTDQMRARFRTDVLAFAPQWVDIEGGGNDITQGRTVAAITADLQAMYDMARAAGVKVIANTVMTSESMAGAKLTANAASGQNQFTVSTTAGAMVGDTVIVDTGSSAETAVVQSAPSGSPGVTGSFVVTLTANLTKSHVVGATVYNLTKMTNLAAVNAWLAKYWRNNPNGVLCSLNAVYQDPVTGGPAPGMAIDGTHPTIDGAAKLGKVKADAVDRFVQEEVHGPGFDVNNLLGAAGAMAGTAGTSTGFSSGGSVTGPLATGWRLFAGSGAETVVASKVARTDLVPGEWQSLDISTAGAGFLSFNNSVPVTAGWAVGDLVWAEVELEIDSEPVAPTATGPLINVCLLAQGGGASGYSMFAASGSDGSSSLIAAGWHRTNLIAIPTGTTGLYVQIQIRVGSCKVRVGRVRIVKGAL